MKIETKTDTNDIYNILEIEKTLCHFPGFPDPKGRNINSNEPIPEPPETSKVKMAQKIFTDGEIIKITEGNPQKISEYRLGFLNYDFSVDTLIKEQVYIKNANYILVVTFARKGRSAYQGRGYSWKYYIMNSKIFLNSKKDIQSLLTAKMINRDIVYHYDACSFVPEHIGINGVFYQDNSCLESNNIAEPKLIKIKKLTK